MKKLLVLAALGALAYTYGKRAANRNAPDAGDTQNARDALGTARVEGGAVDALSAVAEFDERQVALADLALQRGVAGAAASLASMLREEHTDHLDRVRSLGADIGVTLDASQDDVGATAVEDATLLRLEGLDQDNFEAGWLAAVTDGHTRMLERIDDMLLPFVNDERVAEHLRLVRDDIEMHLQNALALGGGRDEANAA